MSYGTKTLQALGLRGGTASLQELARDVDVGEDRLAPIVAGLHHNGYVVRNFAPEQNSVALTEEGRQFVSRWGITVAAPPNAAPAAAQAPAPQSAQSERPRLEPENPRGEAEPQRTTRRRTTGQSRSGESGPVVEIRKPRRRSKAAGSSGGGEDGEGDPVATDGSGFVTHIKGKAIF